MKRWRSLLGGNGSGSGERERIWMSAAEGGREERCAMNGSWPPGLEEACRRVVKGFGAEAVGLWRVEIRDFDDVVGGIGVDDDADVGSGFGDGAEREGRKKGAFSGALGGVVGLLRWAMVSRCRRVCQRDFGTRLSV